MDDYDLFLLRERNEEIQEIESDMIHLQSMMQTFSTLIFNQGADIDIVAENVEETVVNVEEGTIALEQAVDWKSKSRNLAIDAGTILGGLCLGSMGFLATPMVGVPTLVAGLVGAVSIVTIRRR
jgi:hypothetical protein